MKINPTIFFALIMGSAFAANHELLHFEFNDSSSIGKQASDSLPTASVVGNVSFSGDFPGAADFNNGGLLRIANFVPPKGAFSIEARFRLRTFSPDGNPYISDLVNTATWDSHIQGFSLRVGGGYLYPVLPKAAYSDSSQYQRSVKEFGNMERASLSRCLGELMTAAKVGGTAPWLEVFSDRCVELETWTHMVGVWDGKAMRIYLNGKDATDPWRINGAGSLPELDSPVKLSIGGRGNGSSDSRPFNGVMDFVRMVDTAMSEKQISSHYLDSFTSEKRNNICQGITLPIAPASGEFAGGDLAFRLSVFIHSACMDVGDKFDLDLGDSLEIEIAKDPNFKEVVQRFTLGDTVFRPNEITKSAKEQPKGECYFRARIVKSKGKALAKGSALEPAILSWSDPRAFFWDPTSSSVHISKIQKRPTFRAVVLRPGAGMFISGVKQPYLYGLSGKKLDLVFVREADGWRLAPSASLSAGLLFLRMGK